MGRRHYHKKRIIIKTFRVNQQIRALQVKLIDDQGNLLGIMPTEEAFQLAHDKGLDLIEVSPKEEPPVVRILHYGKFKYDQEKKKQKSKPKKTTTKGIRITLNMGAHDLETREKQARKFITEGNRVQIEIILKGRERMHNGRAFDQVRGFVECLTDISNVSLPVTKKQQKIFTLIEPKPQ